MITKRFKLPWLAEAGPLEILASARSGHREMVIVQKLGSERQEPLGHTFQ